MRKKIAILLVSILFCLSIAGCNATQQNVSSSSTISANIDIVSETKQALEKIKTGKYTELYEIFDEKTQKQLSVDVLEQSCESMINSMGAIKTEIASSATNNVGTITLEMENGTLLDFKVTFNKKNKITGLVFIPANISQQDTPVPDAITETALTITTQDYKLPALLSIPKDNTQPIPAVILVHGSGPNDKNETIGGSAIFKDLAYGLAKQGIAVLRYDKRTLVYAQELDADTLTLKEETTDDVVSAITLLQNTAGINKDKIYVLGHSLGGMALPLIAEENQSVAGFIALAAPARKLEELILEQSNYLLSFQMFDKEQSDSISKDYEKQIKAIQSLTKDSELSANQLLGMPKNYWLFLNEYDQVKKAKNITKPILFLQGERDYQVTMEDFNIFQTALKNNSNAQFISYPNLNHLFITGEGKSIPEEYMETGSIDETVIADIADFIKKS